MLQRLFIVLLMAVGVLVGCETSAEDDNNDDNRTTLRIVSGSENRSLEPLIQQFATENNVDIIMEYAGSVDISLMLQGGIETIEYDAVWPANSLWLTLGDRSGITDHEESILRSPVVLGIKKSIAEELGWIDADVTVDDILQAADNNEFQLMMTSATQSNSGASAYFGFLYALSGNPEVLTAEDLNSPGLEERITALLNTIDRSSRSSGFLKELFLNQYNRYDAMINYEALIIEFNQELGQMNRDSGMDREPLYTIYPTDGLTIADSPLAYVDKGDEEKETLFLELQAYLLSEPVQNQLLALGRRTGRIGLDVQNPNLNVFNPDWGINTDLTIVPIRLPTASVIEEALSLYQTAFRKASFTVYCLDYSGSMEGAREQQLETAMFTLLDQEQARRYLLQTSSKDITVVIPFNHEIIQDEETDEELIMRVEGNNDEELMQLFRDIQVLYANGGTEMYTCGMEALRIIQNEVSLDDQFPAIIMMSDGASGDAGRDELRQALIDADLSVPVYAIRFGESDPSQLNELAELTSGDVYDGRTDLIDAFRRARGNN